MTADPECVVERLQTKGVLGPLVPPEVAGHSAYGEDQPVPFDYHASRRQRASGEIDLPYLAHVRAHPSISGEHTSDRCSDVGCGQPGHRDLVQEGLKQVVVLPVDQHDVRVAPETLAELQAPETTADDRDHGPSIGRRWTAGHGFTKGGHTRVPSRAMASSVTSGHTCRFR